MIYMEFTAYNLLVFKNSTGLLRPYIISLSQHLSQHYIQYNYSFTHV